MNYLNLERFIRFKEISKQFMDVSGVITDYLFFSGEVTRL
jgi:hypothetical protein